jgi:hypothetical protein
MFQHKHVDTDSRCMVLKGRKEWSLCYCCPSLIYLLSLSLSLSFILDSSCLLDFSFYSSFSFHNPSRSALSFAYKKAARRRASFFHPALPRDIQYSSQSLLQTPTTNLTVRDFSDNQTWILESRTVVRIATYFKGQQKRSAILHIRTTNESSRHSFSYK